jgi:hypothetical protein
MIQNRSALRSVRENWANLRELQERLGQSVRNAAIGGGFADTPHRRRNCEAPPNVAEGSLRDDRARVRAGRDQDWPTRTRSER